ncbi:MAG: DUF309 domain-containing protein [Nitrospiraceae bacterium]
MSESRPSDSSWPRYTTRLFPPYRFVPGQSPHPRRDPKGHSYGQPEPQLAAFPPEHWRQAEEYLYGIDLYNYAYWWECHEVFESYWHAVGHKTDQGNFFQALIQLAAANLKHYIGNCEATANLARNGLARLEQLPRHYMGVEISVLEEALRRYFDGKGIFPRVRLSTPDGS